MGRKPKPETKLIRTSIQLSPAQREAIKAQAEFDGITESEFIRQAITFYLLKKEGKVIVKYSEI